MSKLRVAVFMGGRSLEKEASFNSGRTICDHLDTARYTIIPLFQNTNGFLYILPARFLHRGKISDFEHRLDAHATRVGWNDLKNLIDFIYIAAHGKYVEDGVLQGFLELLHIPYLGSKVFASALNMNKTAQKDILTAHKIAVPKSFTVTPELLAYYTHNQEQLAMRLNGEKIGIPCIVKPQAEGSSFGVKKVNQIDELLQALKVAATLNPGRMEAVLVEEYLTGMEFTCIVITDYKTGKLMPLAPTEIIPEAGTNIFDYDQKYMPGRALKFTPARCTSALLKKIQDTSMRVMEILDIKNLARIDGFVCDNETIVITDPNTLAGMAPSSFIFRQAAELNMSHTQFINHLIETELHYYHMTPKDLDMQQERAVMNLPKKLRIGVLLGGSSHEKEISLESGRNVIYKLSPQKYEAIPIFVDAQLKLYRLNQALLVRNSTKEIQIGLTPDLEITWSALPELCDFIFIGLHGGVGENGCVQGALEMLDMAYNGSGVLASALCMDKYKLNNFLKNKGLSVPENLLVGSVEWDNNCEEIIQKIKEISSYPLIVKPHDDGCSVLVKKVYNASQLKDALEEIFKDGKTHALVEEFITGMELTVGVIGNTQAYALPPSRAVSSQDILSIEEKFLPGAGENQTPAPLEPASLAFVKKTMEDAYTLINCKGYVRIDCFYQNGQESPTGQERVIFLEVNTLPGLTPATCLFHQAAEIGLNPMEFIDLIIQLGLEQHKKTDSQNIVERTIIEKLQADQVTPQH